METQAQAVSFAFLNVKDHGENINKMTEASHRGKRQPWGGNRKHAGTARAQPVGPVRRLWGPWHQTRGGDGPRELGSQAECAGRLRSGRNAGLGSFEKA